MTSFEQRTFETAVSSSASIVKPTVPKNVLAEFEHFAATGNRYRKANPFDDDGPAPEQQQRAPAPLPPPQLAMPPPPPQPVQQQQPQRPVDFSQFGDFSMRQQAAVSQQQQQSEFVVDLMSDTPY